MSTLLDNLRVRWDETSAQMTAITERAAAENRDLNDVERSNFDALRTQLGELEPRITELVDIERSLDATAERFASISHEGRGELATQQAPAILRSYESPGHYLHDVFRAFGNDADMAARDRIRQVALVRRDATTTINGATVQNETLAEAYGIVPEQMVGSIWEGIDRRRPVAESFVLRTITGPVMFRPKVVQHTQVGPQGTGTPAGAAGAGVLGLDTNGAVATNDEKSAFVSRKMILGRLNIEPIAIGGVVDVSMWAEMLSPGFLNIIVSDLAGEYAIQTEALACAELARAAATNPATDWDTNSTTSGEDLNAAIYEAASLVHASVGSLPTHVAMSVDVWAKIGSLADGNGRPLFPPLGPMNAPGTSSADSFSGPVDGLTKIVSSGLPADTLVVYSAQNMESFERRLGVLQAIEPERAGRVVSYSGLYQAIAMDDGAASAIAVTAV
jgi:HK97 family phage major capsid protein